MASAIRSAVPSSKVGSGALAGETTVWAGTAGPGGAALALGLAVCATAGAVSKAAASSVAGSRRMDLLASSNPLKSHRDIRFSRPWSLRESTQKNSPTRTAPTTGIETDKSVLPKASKMLADPRCFCFVGAGCVKVHPAEHPQPARNYGRLMDAIMPQPLLMCAIAAFLLASAVPAAAQNRNPVCTADQKACCGRVYDRGHLA